MFDLFGPEMPLPAKFFIAFAAVLALIGITAWLVRRFGANRLGGANARGRQPRLAVIDAATVDGRRRLVLIRRDNVEHLMMIGGPSDVVVEQNIVRAAPAGNITRETPRAPEPAARQPAQVENGWPLQPISESAPVTPPRPYRAAATEEPWHAPEPGARPRPASSESSLTGLAAELSNRLGPADATPPIAPPVAPPVAPPAARHEPPVRSSPPPAPQAAHEPGTAPQTDHNLAEMAQQLEAALRRAPAAEARPPVTDPLAAKPVEPPRRDYKLRVDPRIDVPPEFKSEAKGEGKAEDWPEPNFERNFDQKFEPKFDAPTEKTEPKLDPPPAPRNERRPEPRVERPAPAKPAAPPGKTVYDSLEEEMASLLGRPPGKT